MSRSKPLDCTCQYPEIIARNMNGHDTTCPIYARWAAERLSAGQQNMLKIKRNTHITITGLDVIPLVDICQLARDVLADKSPDNKFRDREPEDSIKRMEAFIKQILESY